MYSCVGFKQVMADMTQFGLEKLMCIMYNMLIIMVTDLHRQCVDAIGHTLEEIQSARTHYDMKFHSRQR